MFRQTIFSLVLIATVFFGMNAFGEGTKAAYRRPANEGEAESSSPPTTSGGASKGVALYSADREVVPGWRARNLRYGIGYESTTIPTTPLPQNAIAFQGWLAGNWGYDLFFGATKTADSALASVSQVDNLLSSPNTRTQTTTNSGSANPLKFILGGTVKYCFFQNDWLQIYGGLLAFFIPPNSASYLTGTKTETFADLTNTGTKSVVETSYGTITSDTAFTFGLGPKIGSEFYLRWFPHLGLGFSTGIVTYLTGDTTTTTALKSRTYNVIDSVEQTPGASTTTTTVATSKPGSSYSTFGLGGSTFSFTGTFTIRYLW